MERRIWKFSTPLRELRDIIEFAVPAGARFISAINQRESLCLYAEVDPTEKMRMKREFAVFGTGSRIVLSPDYRFLGTVVFSMGELVYHIYDVGEL